MISELFTKYQFSAKHTEYYSRLGHKSGVLFRGLRFVRNFRVLHAPSPCDRYKHSSPSIFWEGEVVTKRILSVYAFDSVNHLVTVYAFLNVGYDSLHFHTGSLIINIFKVFFWEGGEPPHTQKSTL